MAKAKAGKSKSIPKGHATFHKGEMRVKIVRAQKAQQNLRNILGQSGGVSVAADVWLNELQTVAEFVQGVGNLLQE